MGITSYEVHTLTMPEGEVSFVTAVVRQASTGIVFPTNLVIGSDFDIDWESASPEVHRFSTTVLLWGSSPESIETNIEQFGYSLVDESDGVLATSDYVMELLGME